jgi:ribosomal protein L15
MHGTLHASHGLDYYGEKKKKGKRLGMKIDRSNGNTGGKGGNNVRSSVII